MGERMNLQYRDRSHAGAVLAGLLGDYARRDDVLVLGLPRGGVPVAYQVAGALGAPLDVFLVRKLGVPGREELAMGAIASGGVRVVSHDILHELDIPMAAVDAVAAREGQELERRERLYRGGRSMPSLKGCTVMLVDDGLATGATMEAAVLAVRQHEPARIVVAVPVGAPDTCERLRRVADDVVCVFAPASFRAVGSWYECFDQTSDAEVIDSLSRSAAAARAQHDDADGHRQQRAGDRVDDVVIAADDTADRNRH